MMTLWQIRRCSKRQPEAVTPPLQTLETRPDLFAASQPSQAVQGKVESVASLAMSGTSMPDLASLKVTS